MFVVLSAIYNSVLSVSTPPTPSELISSSPTTPTPPLLLTRTTFSSTLATPNVSLVLSRLGCWTLLFVLPLLSSMSLSRPHSMVLSATLLLSLPTLMATGLPLSSFLKILVHTAPHSCSLFVISSLNKPLSIWVVLLLLSLSLSLPSTCSIKPSPTLLSAETTVVATA